MKSPQGGRLFESLRRMASQPDAPEVRDSELLGPFVQERDETAFEAIVRRHGPMVLAVCRRRLGNDADAEDAFQAAFLVLARDAPRIGNRESLPGWLFRVAYLVALKMMGKNARRRSLPLPDVAGGGDHADALVREELRSILEEEVNALPDRFRGAVVLCYLEGRSNSEAAALLGCPKGTIDSRLATARKRLLGRLLRRGVALPAAFGVEVLLVCEASARGAFNELVSKTVPAAVQLAVAGSAAGMVPDYLSTIADGVTTTMSLSKSQIAVVLSLALAMLGGGVGLYCATAGQPGPGRGAGLDAPAAPDNPKQDELSKAEAAKKARQEAQATREKVLSPQVIRRLAFLKESLNSPLPMDRAIYGVPLKEVIDYLEDVASPLESKKDPSLRVKIIADGAAFMALKGEKFRVEDELVHLPRLTGAPLEVALRKLCEQLGCTYAIRKNHIELTTFESVAGRPLRKGESPQLVYEYEWVKMPVAALLDILAERHQRTVLISTQLGDRAQTPVTAKLLNVPFDTAVELVAEMAGLKAVRKDNALFVTTPEHANTLLAAGTALPSHPGSKEK
jgi:RNA polymerase sigma factor (sigma-70 family)